MADAYTELARASFESYTNNGVRIEVPDGLGEDLVGRRAGCFVSLHKEGMLRGCIGTLGPVQTCLAEEIIENAISACSRDPRFPPVAPDELAAIECSVDVLGLPEAIDDPEQLDVRRYGVIVSRGFKRGVLLPDLEGVDTVEMQVAIAKQKAGIAQSESCDLQRFEVVRHHE